MEETTPRDSREEEAVTNAAAPGTSAPAADRSRQPRTVRHSGLGIASFIIAVTMLVAILCSFAAIAGMTADLFSQGTWPDQQSLIDRYPLIVLFAFIIMGALLLDFVGGVLGVVALFQKERKKLFGALGAAFSFVPIVGFVLLFLLGRSLIAP